MLGPRPHRSAGLPDPAVPIVLVDADGAEITTVWLEHWLMQAIGELVADERSRYDTVVDALADVFECAWLEFSVHGQVPGSCLTCAMTSSPHSDHIYVPQPWATLPEGS